jgi:hypothetical protein
VPRQRLAAAGGGVVDLTQTTGRHKVRTTKTTAAAGTSIARTGCCCMHSCIA